MDWRRSFENPIELVSDVTKLVACLCLFIQVSTSDNFDNCQCFGEDGLTTTNKKLLKREKQIIGKENQKYKKNLDFSKSGLKVQVELWQ